MQGDKNGYVEHIIETNTKFMQLLKDMAKERIDLEDLMLHGQEREEKLLSLRNHYRDIHERTDKDFRDLDGSLREQLKGLREKLEADNQVGSEIQAQLNKVQKNMNDAKTKFEELSKYITEKKLMDDIQREVDDDEERILKEQLISKAEIVDVCKETRDTMKKALESDEKLGLLNAKQLELQEELKKKQIEASDTEYKVLEIEARQQLAIKIKDKEAEDRKNLFEEHEILRDKLEEETRKNNDRIAKKLRESSFEELGKKDIILRKQQEELNNLRVQYDKIHKEYKNFKLDEFRKTKYFEKLKAENEEYADRLF